MPSFRELLAETKKRIREVDTVAAEQDWLTKPGVVVLDVREPEEYEQGALPNAMHIPRGHLESNFENRIADHDAPVLVYCASGVRSLFAADPIQTLGFTNVVHMA